MKPAAMNTNQADKPLHRERRFYSIEENSDGTVDVYLIPSFAIYRTPDGFAEYDIDIRVVRGITPWDGLEEDIRRRYEAWCESGEAINT